MVHAGGEGVAACDGREEGAVHALGTFREGGDRLCHAFSGVVADIEDPRFPVADEKDSFRVSFPISWVESDWPLALPSSTTLLPEFF